MSALRLPPIVPIRNPGLEIPKALYDPSPYISGDIFPDGYGPRVVYLDEAFTYPEQQDESVQAERARQNSIWEQIYASPDWCTVLDQHVLRPSTEAEINAATLVARSEEVEGSAGFYGKIISRLLGQELRIVCLATGITLHTREPYHDLGFLAASR